jgi:hypothetical protein
MFAFADHCNKKLIICLTKFCLFEINNRSPQIRNNAWDFLNSENENQEKTISKDTKTLYPKML